MPITETTPGDMLAAPAATPTAGGVVAIPIVLVILVVIVYLCRRRRNRTITAFLGFLAGVLLAGTTFGSTIAAGSVQLITDTISATGGIFR